jgi:hypothetical protein
VRSNGADNDYVWLERAGLALARYEALKRDKTI